MEQAALAARALLAGVLAAAAIAKALDLRASGRAAAALGVPERLAPAAGVAVPALEATAAVLLLAPDVAVVGAGLAIVLLGAFTVVLAVNLAGGRRPACNCFGQASEAPISAMSLARNLALLAVAVVATAGAGADPAIAVPALAAAVVAQSVLVAPLVRAGRPGSPRAAGGEGEGLAIGAAAPDFDLAGLDGGRRTLAELRDGGRHVLVLFVDAACGPCAAIAPEIAGWQSGYAETLSVAVVASGDAERLHAKFADVGVANVLLQPGTAVADAYRYAGTPGAVVVDPDGRIASQLASGAPDIRSLVEATAARLAPPGHEIPVAIADARAVGDPAPYVFVDALDGGSVSLGHLGGRLVLVVFWDPGCGFCQSMLADWHDWYAAKPESLGVVVLADGDPDATRAQGLAALVGLDPGGLNRRAFGAKGTPMAVLVDAKGRIASTVAEGAGEVLALAARAARLAAIGEKVAAPAPTPAAAPAP